MISVFDMFSIGIGPSSSHTVGPMRAAKAFIADLINAGQIAQIDEVQAELYGSLGQTGIGHGSGKAVILGFCGHAPESIDPDIVDNLLLTIDKYEQLTLENQQTVKFPRKGAIVFNRRKSLPYHSNGMTFRAKRNNQVVTEQTYYSIGGGFIYREDEYLIAKQQAHELSQTESIPYEFRSAQELVAICKENGLSIPSLMMANERTHIAESVLREKLWEIWETMKACVYRGIRTEGILPGGLKVKRRAPTLHRRLTVEQSTDPLQVMDWVNLFALAINEENAAGGRVVTAPTNGAAGILPAVLMYYDKYIQSVDHDIIVRYLLTAAAIGILYKRNASISGAEVGCQGEVGVACSMAAGALTEILGGTVDNVENAAEIGMEHNLGLTCDPVGGLVQVPCIERNAMGAIKAINAARMAMRGTGDHKVSLDKVIKTMRDTGNDMKSKYKETARGGLAVNIIEC